MEKSYGEILRDRVLMLVKVCIKQHGRGTPLEIVMTLSDAETLERYVDSRSDGGGGCQHAGPFTPFGCPIVHDETLDNGTVRVRPS